MAIVGALYLIGIPGALLLGVLAGLLEFVPYFGPIVSAVYRRSCSRSAETR